MHLNGVLFVVALYLPAFLVCFGVVFIRLFLWHFYLIIYTHFLCDFCSHETRFRVNDSCDSEQN